MATLRAAATVLHRSRPPGAGAGAARAFFVRRRVDAGALSCRGGEGPYLEIEAGLAALQTCMVSDTLGTSTSCCSWEPSCAHRRERSEIVPLERDADIAANGPVSNPVCQSAKAGTGPQAAELPPRAESLF